MAAVNNNNSYARAVNTPVDNLWACTAKPMFDEKMADWGKFDNIGLSDLRGDNSILLMTQFCQRVATLMEVGINRANKIRAASKNTYRRNNSSSRTGLAAASAIANRARQEAARSQARTQRVDPGPLLPAAATANNNSVDGDSRPI